LMAKHAGRNSEKVWSDMGHLRIGAKQTAKLARARRLQNGQKR
jgi:hypothetical protein